MRHTIPFMLLCVLTLTGCERPSQNAYREGEVGHMKAIEYGTVTNARAVDIIGTNSGTGMLLGAAAGGGAASYVGGGSGQTWATAAGAVAGAVAGSMIEQEAQDRQGVEYTVAIEGGGDATIVQDIAEGDVVFETGDKVMIQTCPAGKHYQKCKATEGGYQRVLPAPATHKPR